MPNAARLWQRMIILWNAPSIICANWAEALHNLAGPSNHLIFLNLGVQKLNLGTSDFD